MATPIVVPTKALANYTTPFAITSAQLASVPMRPYGPCCSVDPIGSIMPEEWLRYCSTSCHVWCCNNMHLSLRSGSCRGLNVERGGDGGKGAGSGLRDRRCGTDVSALGYGLYPARSRLRCRGQRAALTGYIGKDPR